MSKHTTSVAFIRGVGMDEKCVDGVQINIAQNQNNLFGLPQSKIKTCVDICKKEIYNFFCAKNKIQRQKFDVFETRTIVDVNLIAKF